MAGNFAIRLATTADIPALRELIDQSVRVLQREDYSAEQLDAALGTAYGVDTQLIADGTYFVVEAAGAACEKMLAACGARCGEDPSVFCASRLDAAWDCELDSENLRRCRICARVPAV
jgi:hypothetical protein